MRYHVSCLMQMMFFCLLIQCLLGQPALLFSQILRAPDATVHLPTELRFVSSRRYSHPINDVQVRATFIHRPSGQSRTITGFWAGGNLYAVRFAPTLAGFWEYRITASDTSNRSLHGLSGSFMTKPPSEASSNPLVKHGFLRVATTQRTLEHSDGTPFFWLGDTAWEMAIRATTPEILRFLDDRQRKGFTVLQTTPVVLAEDDTRNRNGTALYLNNDRTLINPRFFDEFDSIVTWANMRGMVVALVPQWANGGVEGYDRGWVRKITTQAEALVAAEYIGSRYAAHQMVWIVGGDVRYETPQGRAYWERFGRRLREADGGLHLISIHPEGLTASYDFFNNSESWLDFGMLQSSHQPWSNDRTALIRRGYDLIPAKPVLNAEPPYEDFILNSFFSDFEASFVGGKRRATAHDIRVAAYISILNGGLVGITYGANGIFQWNSASMPNPGHTPRFTIDSALNFSGSRQMGIMRNLLQRWHWEDMLPRVDLLIGLETPLNPAPFHGIMASNEALTMYIGGAVRSVSLACSALRGEGGFAIQWVSPETGQAVADSLPYTFQPITLYPPVQTGSASKLEEQDWLLYIRRTSPIMKQDTLRDSTVIALTRIRSDRTNGIVEFGITAQEVGTLDIEVYNALGVSLLNQRFQSNRGEQYFVLSIPVSGAYFYRATFQNKRVQHRINGKFIQQ